MSKLNSLIEFFHSNRQTSLKRVSEEDYVKRFIEKSSHEQLVKAYDKVWEEKNFEIENYWKRGNYFWAFQVASFAGYFSLIGSDAYSDSPQVLFAVICIGIVTSFAWALTNLGSKSWQRHWEIHVDLLEEKVTVPLYKIVTTKRTYSVSKINDIVSRFFIVIWFVLAAKYFIDHLNFNYKNIESLDYLVLISTITTIAFVYAMFFGHGRGRFGKRKVQLFMRDYKVHNSS